MVFFLKNHNHERGNGKRIYKKNNKQYCYVKCFDIF